MINLAGVADADKYVEEELYLAGIPFSAEKSDGEVPYTVIGALEGWEFRRAWYYYEASCFGGLGLPYNLAVRLHEKKYPMRFEQYSIFGKVVRVDGDCSCPHPEERKYPTLGGIEVLFVEARVRFPDVVFDSEEAFGRSHLRELDGIKYVRLYHIDTLVGLKEFADTVARGA